jgi:hypothetical protein
MVCIPHPTCAAFGVYLTRCDLPSCWNHLDHSRLLPDFAPLQHCLLRSQGLGDRIHHCDGSTRCSLCASILYLGAVLLSGAIPSVEVSEGANDDRFVLVIRRDVHIYFVSDTFFDPSYQKHTTNSPDQYLE